MEWTRDVSIGDWIRAALDDPQNSTMHDVVPRGFDVFVRVFHPATRDRPVNDAWPPPPYDRHTREWEAFHRRDPEIMVEFVDWHTTASALGTRMHPLAQWNRIVGIDETTLSEDEPRDAAGWRYTAPEVGAMPAETTAALAAVLSRHTSTPDDGAVALWEGVGGLVGFVGDAPSRTFFSFGAADGTPERSRHEQMLARSVKDHLNHAFRTPTWQEGILSREVSEGPRLELPGRGYVLFRGGVAELARPDWVESVPWRDREAETHGFPPAAQTPSLIWPTDRAWVVVTDVDFDSTVVGATREAADALLADPSLEALELPPDASLAWDADTLNR